MPKSPQQNPSPLAHAAAAPQPPQDDVPFSLARSIRSRFQRFRIAWLHFFYRRDTQVRRVLCLDYKSEALEIARGLWAARSNIKYLRGDALRLPFPDNALDAVCFMEALEHFDKPAGESVLKEIRRILKPSGWLFASMPIAFRRADVERGLKNPSRIYIWREPKLREFLSGLFSHSEIILHYYFHAQK